MLTVGRITKLFGVKGEVVINLYDTLPDNFNWEEQPFFTKVEELVVPLFCDSVARRGQRSAVVAFADIDNEKRAEKKAAEVAEKIAGLEDMAAIA